MREMHGLVIRHRQPMGAVVRADPVLDPIAGRRGRGRDLHVGRDHLFFGHQWLADPDRGTWLSRDQVGEPTAEFSIALSL